MGAMAAVPCFSGSITLKPSSYLNSSKCLTEVRGSSVIRKHCTFPKRTAFLLHEHTQGSSLRNRHCLSGRKNESVFGKGPLEHGRRVNATGSAGGEQQSEQSEVVYFDGGPHIGDLLVNLLLGLTVLWLPLTLASVAKAFVLRYRFTNKRVTIVSGYGGVDRKDFGYGVIKDVKSVPRFIGEWGDIVLELSDGTKVDLSSVPKFREVVAYTLKRAKEEQGAGSESDDDVATTTPGKGFASSS